MNKLFSYIVKKYQPFKIKLYKAFSTNNVIGKPKLVSPTLFIGKGTITIKDTVEVGYFPSPFYYNSVNHIEARFKEASIEIKDNVRINNSFTIIAEKGAITIGEKCLIGTEVFIVNSDFHELHPEKRNSGNHKSKNVVIGNNVFIGSRVTILKGVTVGDNSVIASGAVVTKSFPENSIIAGNPAAVVKQINHD